MSLFIIEQDQAEIAQSFELHTNSALDILRLVRAEIVGPSEPEKVEGELQTSFSFKPAAVKRLDGSLGLQIDFQFNIFKTPDGAQPQRDYVSIHCTFEARYLLRPGFQPTDDQISAFHKGNAIFNSWPFFREFIQNTAVRLNVSPPPVPFMRVQPSGPGRIRKSRRPSKTGEAHAKEGWREGAAGLRQVPRDGVGGDIG